MVWGGSEASARVHAVVALMSQSGCGIALNVSRLSRVKGLRDLCVCSLKSEKDG